MDTATVGTKGQVVIPSSIRKRYKIKKGTLIYFILEGEQITLKPVTEDYIHSLRGSLNTQGKTLKLLLKEKKKERAL